MQHAREQRRNRRTRGLRGGAARSAFLASALVAAAGCSEELAVTDGLVGESEDPLVWSEHFKLLAGDGESGDYFGHAVALSGELAVVGAHQDDVDDEYQGSAYVFVRTGSSWAEEEKLTAADHEYGALFGRAVAIHGERVLIGAPNHDENAADSGAAYVFVRTASNWAEEAKLSAADGEENDLFGGAVALSADRAVVGARQDDDNGPYAGSAYVFVRTASNWAEEAKLLPQTGFAGMNFGPSVASDGDVAVIGATEDRSNNLTTGSAYVFVRSATSWSEQTRLLAQDGEEGDRLGFAVGLSGSRVLAGAFWDDDQGSQSGSAYVFTRNGASWTQEAKLLAGDGGVDQYFGHSVSLNSQRALIGAFGDETQGLATGAAYVFLRDGSVWSEERKLLASDAEGSDFFGVSVGLDGDQALVGAHIDQVANVHTGSAYLFMLKSEDGDPCGEDEECASGFCVDGVCCDTACGGGIIDDCQVCVAAEGAQEDGTCGPRTDGAPCADGVCIDGACTGAGGGGAGAGGVGGAGAGGVGGSGTGAGGTGGQPLGEDNVGQGVDQGGCGCRLAAARAPARRWAGLELLALIGVVVRRRQTRSPTG